MSICGIRDSKIKAGLISAVLAVLLTACSGSASTSDAPGGESKDSIAEKNDVVLTSYANPLPQSSVFEAKGWSEIQFGSPFVISDSEFAQIGSSEERLDGEVLIGVRVRGTFVGDGSEDLYNLMGNCNPSAIATAQGNVFEFVQSYDREGAWNPPPVDDGMNDVLSGFSQEGIAIYKVKEGDTDFRMMLSSSVCSDLDLFVDLGPLE